MKVVPVYALVVGEDVLAIAEGVLVVQDVQAVLGIAMAPVKVDAQATTGNILRMCQKVLFTSYNKDLQSTIFGILTHPHF